MSMGCANYNSATSTSIISSSIATGVRIEHVSSTLDSLEQIRPSLLSPDGRKDKDIYHYAKSIQFQVVNILKCISNALDGTTTQHKAPCLVHNIQINVSTSFGAFGKRFIEDIATISWYASLFPCYLQHYFTQQLEKWETQSDIHWKRKKQTNPMIYRFPLPLLELIYSITVEIGWYFHVTWKK